MKEEPLTAAVLRQFLLGKLDDEEQENIERRFISDADSHERMLAAEQDLIEDYLDDGLAVPDKNTFLSRYAQTPEQRRKIVIASSLEKYAVTQALEQSKPTAEPIGKPWASIFRLKPAYLIPIAASLLVVVLLAAFWLANRTNQSNAQHSTIERELARLNATANLHEALPQMSLLVLPPVSLRSIERPTEFAPRADIHFVELRLLWIQKEQYQSYRAVLTKVGGGEQYRISDLQLENDEGNIIRVRLPVAILTRGVYKISLSGTSNNTCGSS